MAEDLRPHSWEQYVGQHKLKEQLFTYAVDAKADHRPLGHVLLAAEPGYGKTSLAQLIADEVRDPFFHLTMSANMKPQTLLAFFNSFHGGVVMFDEFHLLPDRLQEALFVNPLEDGFFTTPNGRQIEIPWFTAIIATSQPEEVLPSIRRRIHINNLTFDPYSDEELGLIVAGIATKMGIDLDPQVAEGLGRAAGGRPGGALPLVYTARALAKQGPLTLKTVLDFCEVDEDGVTKEHRRLLAAVDKLAGVGYVGMERLSDYVGMHPSMIRGHERLLFDRGLISYGAGGRELTSEGIARIRGNAMPIPSIGGYRERGAA